MEGEEGEYRYFLVKLPIGITDRDFIHCYKRKEDFPRIGVTQIHYKSKDHPECPPKKGIIRAHSILGGY